MKTSSLPICSEPPVGIGAGKPEEVCLAWDMRLRLLRNAHLWGTIAAVFGISCALLSVLLLFISKSAFAIVVGAEIFGGLMFLFLAIAMVIDLCGGFRMKFALTSAGVRSVVGNGAKYAADTAFWLGFLAGKPGAMGAGLLARSEQNVFIPYASVAKVKLSPRSRSILVKGGVMDKPIRLYCTARKYPRAEAILRAQCQHAIFA